MSRPVRCCPCHLWQLFGNWVRRWGRGLCPGSRCQARVVHALDGMPASPNWVAEAGV